MPLRCQAILIVDFSCKLAALFGALGETCPDAPCRLTEVFNGRARPSRRAEVCQAAL